MTNDDLKARGAATAEFEENLESLVLYSYSNGAAIEGIWTITSPLESVPDWKIAIEKDISKKGVS